MNIFRLFLIWLGMCCAIASAWGIGGLPSHNASLSGSACNNFSFGNSVINNTWSASPSGQVVMSLSAGSTVIVSVHLSHPTTILSVSSMTSPNLTYSRHFTMSRTDTGGDTIRQTLEVWWAHASTHLVNETITTTGSGSPDTATIVAGEYQCLTNPPWDVNASLPGSNASSSGTITCPAAATLSSNTNAPTVIWINGSPASAGIPSGFTGYSASASNLGVATNSFQRDGYHTVMPPVQILNQQYTTGSSGTSWMVYCDVVDPL
jgi:hypothetical protein